MTGSRKYNFKCQSFPNTIEQERRRRGWTVTKLAELSGVSRYSIAAYETWAAGGIVPKQQMKSVTDTTAQMIADALEVTPEQLFKHYAEAAAEHKPRVKPFSTRAERDGAILKALEPAKYTALKMPTTLEECIRRIQSDESRAHNRKLNEKLAAEWFEKYDASRRNDEIPPTKIF